MQKLVRIVGLVFTIIMSISAYAEDAPSTAFSLNTTAFLDTGAMPVLYTCDGKDISPEFDWTNVPAKTQSLVILVSDPEAPSGLFYHWVVYNIPTSTATLPENATKLPAGALIGKNDFGKLQYNGPCPPKGSAHTYTFGIYALDTKLDLAPGANGKAVAAAMQKHVLGKVELTGVYSRWNG